MFASVEWQVIGSRRLDLNRPFDRTALNSEFWFARRLVGFNMTIR